MTPFNSNPRVVALKALIERVEAGFQHGGPFLDGRLMDETDAALLHRQDTWAAMSGSLDAVVRLEAPLRERGWRFGVLPWMGKLRALAWAPEAPVFYDRAAAEGVAPPEARARLLAVLRALLHEAETL